MRILITGMSGQVGSALVPALKAIGAIIPADSRILDFAEPHLIPAILDRLQPSLIV